MGRPRSGKLPQKPLKHMTERHREMARRLVLGERQYDVARSCGISQQRLSDIVRSPVFMAYMEQLSTMREQRTGDILQDVRRGATNGLGLLLRVLTEGTEENRGSSISTRVNVARDLLDREGSAPRVSKRQAANQESSLYLTADDIERLKRRVLERKPNITSSG